MRERSMQTPGSVQKEGQEVLQALELKSSEAPRAVHGEGAVPLQPMGIHNGAEIHLQPQEETHTRAGGCAQRMLWSCGKPAQVGPVAPWKEQPMLEQVYWQDL